MGMKKFSQFMQLKDGTADDPQASAAMQSIRSIDQGLFMLPQYFPEHKQQLEQFLEQWQILKTQMIEKFRHLVQ